ncbi:MAG: 30S ribosomal protein S13 [Proteobacteria bacterium]|nr:30S ribosomal protein S13 [Pseudomonadota bacterium]
MARISGIDIPNNKRIEYSLTYVKGIGLVLSQKILNTLNIDFNKRAKDLTDSEVASINSKIQEMQIPVEGELKRIISQNIRRLIEIKSYRGSRHQKGLPARGQKTRANARTRKGKKKTVGGTKKKLAKK